MSRFLVDSRTLLAVRDTLGRLHDQLLGMHTVIFGYWGVLGGSELEGELEHFCGTWHFGVTELAGQVTEMMTRLTGAAAAYERIERRITAAGGTGKPPNRPPSGSGTTVIGGGGSGHGSTSGSGTTVIGGGPGPSGGGSGPAGGGSRPSGGGSGSGTTVIGGGGSSSSSGSGTTVVGDTASDGRHDPAGTAAPGDGAASIVFGPELTVAQAAF